MAGLTAALGAGATSALPIVEPKIDGIVVQDVTRPYSFDQRYFDVFEGPKVIEDAFQGNVRSQVIRSNDGTYDFYFRISTTLGMPAFFDFRQWQAPADTTVAYHSYDIDDFPEPFIAPTAGESFAQVRGVTFSWLSEVGPFQTGALREAVFVLDTDARAYAMTGTYRLGDFARFLGSYYGDPVAAFAPAVPEPETWLLLFSGLGLLAAQHRRRHTKR